MIFQDKNILLFAPSFFGYELEIINQLSKEGANIDYFDERPNNSNLMNHKTCLDFQTMHR